MCCGIFNSDGVLYCHKSLLSFSVFGSEVVFCVILLFGEVFVNSFLQTLSILDISFVGVSFGTSKKKCSGKVGQKYGCTATHE